MKDNKIDWLSKKKYTMKNKKGEQTEKKAYPAFLYGVISVKKVNQNLTAIKNIICKIIF
jgi:hypothetical protein